MGSPEVGSGGDRSQVGQVDSGWVVDRSANEIVCSFRHYPQVVLHRRRRRDSSVS